MRFKTAAWAWTRLFHQNNWAPTNTHHTWFEKYHPRVLHRQLVSKEEWQSPHLQRQRWCQGGKEQQHSVWSASEDMWLLTAVDEKNIPDFSSMSLFFSRFHLLPPRLVSHLLSGKDIYWQFNPSLCKNVHVQCAKTMTETKSKMIKVKNKTCL